MRVKLDGQNGERLFYREWICTVVGKTVVEVQFGKFDSVEIACERYSRGQWREKRVWYYVPEIGHYVRRVDQFLGRDSRDTELVSIQQGFDGLSRDAKRALYDLEQRTLERMPSGKAANWRSSDGNIAVTMIVTKTMQTEAGQFCRTFRQVITGGDGERLIPGLACRTWNGRWVRSLIGICIKCPLIRLKFLVRTGHPEHMLADIGQNHVRRDRRRLEQPGLAPFALDIVFPGEGEAAEGLKA